MLALLGGRFGGVVVLPGCVLGKVMATEPSGTRSPGWERPVPPCVPPPPSRPRQHIRASIRLRLRLGTPGAPPSLLLLHPFPASSSSPISPHYPPQAVLGAHTPPRHPEVPPAPRAWQNHRVPGCLHGWPWGGTQGDMGLGRGWDGFGVSNTPISMCTLCTHTPQPRAACVSLHTSVCPPCDPCKGASAPHVPPRATLWGRVAATKLFPALPCPHPATAPRSPASPPCTNTFLHTGRAAASPRPRQLGALLHAIGTAQVKLSRAPTPRADTGEDLGGGPGEMWGLLCLVLRG